MYQTNPTETFGERHPALVREADDRRCARRLRKARLKGHPRRSEQRILEEFSMSPTKNS
jgi:hypothetical protein